MSDFDEVLERLLSDPAFKARLAADPAGVLAGYRLTPDELDILRSQVGDAGGQTHVEQRTSKASMFGVFSSIGSGLGDVLHGHGAGVSAHGLAGHVPGGGGAAAGHHMHDLVEQQYGGRHAAVEPPDQGSGPIGRHLEDVAQGGQHASAGFEEVHTESHYESHTEYHSEVRSSGTVYQSSTYAGDTGGTPHEPSGGTGGQGVGGALAGLGGTGGQGVAAGLAGLGDPGGLGGPGGSAGGLAGGLAGLGEHAVPGGHAGGIGAGLGDIGQHAGGQAGLEQAGGPAGAGHGAGIGAGLAGFAEHAGHAQIPGAAPTDGYHTRVDWDGDGRWDQHTYVNRADGGVDIVVDTDGDGRPEFVGHDTNRDGLIDSADVDTNHDGVMDARYEDVNGDGWLDRRTR
ncbi:hypothetical protein [Dactylosporangium sp. NPDC048998]|uniref:hypothetical protein n=1 Tax=Dactylosporangium sp. NPDC048998 TaxID=3363976 RepID=UPI00371D6A0F